MTTLPANSTFLPVLDDLLSPDFRTVSLPGQTPQTPAETPVSATAGKVTTFVESHTGQLTSKASNYPGVVKDQHASSSRPSTSSSDPMTTSIYVQQHPNVNGVGVKKQTGHHRHKSHDNQQNAAVAIQQWWKVRKGRRRHASGGEGTVDLKAERAKHSIRHNRTEDHVRYLEMEVQRLKSALVAERKLRGLQVEAIRSLWGEVQKVSAISGSPGAGDVMTQSMPNGLPVGYRKQQGGGCMTMSLQGNLLDNIQFQSQNELSSCSCTKEIQNLKQSFTSEMAQLRGMIDQLRVEGGSSSSINEDPKASLQKRPLTLNLGGNGGGGRPNEVVEEKKEISGYADLMATSIIEDAKE